MFFIVGVNQGNREIPYRSGAAICGRCGRYGTFQVFMTYMCLSLFFIPVFKWNRRYYTKTSCCGTLYELDPSLGSRLARGEDVTIPQESLIFLQDGHLQPAWETEVKRCSSCGFETKENFDYCPKCGLKF